MSYKRTHYDQSLKQFYNTQVATHARNSLHYQSRVLKDLHDIHLQDVYEPYQLRKAYQSHLADVACLDQPCSMKRTRYDRTMMTHFDDAF